MKSKSLKLLIAAATPIALVTTFGLQTLSSCSSKQEEKICTIKGIVKDIDGTTLKNVTVQCNDKTTKTNASGKFVIECEKPSSIIYFEKEGFLPTAVNEYSYDKTLNISLTPLSETTSKEITFNLVDMQGSYIPNCSLSIYSESSEEYFQHLVTDNVGTCKAEIQVATTGKTFIPFTINNSLYDGQQQILSVDSSTTSVTLTAKPYQYDIKAYVDNKNTDNHIIMHAYHVKNNGDSSLKVSFEANFTGAFTSKRKYTLTFHVGNVPSSPKQTEIIGNDFAIQFNSSKVTQTYGDIVKTKDKNLVKVQLSKSKAYLDVIIPSSFYDLESVGTIGIHLSSSSGSFQPFDHKDASTQVSNQLCYIRLDQDNKYYQASDNNNPFGTLD
ncbi:MAG: carboxypeptidase-like regulatory domain-containing protein [Mycoplasmoidaceae bacterium]|nr:carboxypeptidase-like regulatory domain-containing protein [Mycoplasmoidaceae bacterium]